MAERAALIVVDMQVDFCPGGSLAVPEGDTIVPLINHYIEMFGDKGLPIIASRDWHPPVTSHFRQFGGIWPPHCVQWSNGARFHPDLHLPEDVIIVSKGMDPDKDDYSALRAVLPSGLHFDDYLKQSGVTHLYICGLATDYCVKWTALDGLRKQYRVAVLVDAIKGVNLKPGDAAGALEEIEAAGGKMADLAVVKRNLPG
jgi:nicotinamidase/pyrazinamidase